MALPTKQALEKLIAAIPDHTGNMPPEATKPITHYHYGANQAWNLLKYFDRHTDKMGVQADAREQHLLRLRSLVLLALVESFERLTKELAAVCVDHIADLVLDDRFAKLSIPSRVIAAHFSERSLGKALCEGQVWTDCDAVNARFGRILSDPFSEKQAFQFFPAKPEHPDYWRRKTIDLLWQIRHAIVHNLGAITKSDAAQLRLLRQRKVEAPRLLQLPDKDVTYAKWFLDELADWANQRVAARLATVLTDLHTSDSTLFDPAERAVSVAEAFQLTVTVAGASAQP